MAKPKTDSEIEERIVMEIVVDAHDYEERAMGWFYYIQDAIVFPVSARCKEKRAISPLQVGDEIEIIDIAPQEECEHEMFVMIRYEKKRSLGVPLSQLEVKTNNHEDSIKAINDWHYWVKMGYQF